MDRAFDYGSKGWGFESLRDRKSFLFLLIFTYAYEDIWVACISSLSLILINFKYEHIMGQ